MAGDWIKIASNLHEKPEVIRLASMLGKSRFDIVGRLHRAWSWFDAQSHNGHAKGVTSVTLDDLVSCDGFSAAMIEVGWIEESGDGLTIPNFDRHNGKSAKSRAEATDRKRMSRKSCDIGHAKVVTETRPEKRREEKRREEGGEEEKSASPPPLDFENPNPEKFNPNRMATFEQVMAFAQSQPMAITPECCEAFFDRMEAEGWVTPKGFPLADWRPRFRSWVTAWVNNSNRPNARAK